MKPCKYEIPTISIEFNGSLESIEKPEYECTKHKNLKDCKFELFCNVKKQKEKEEKLNAAITEKETYYKLFVKNLNQKGKK